MPIKVQHGTIESIAELGILAGKSVAAQKQIERTQAMARQAQQMEHERKMTAFRAQLDLESSMRSHQWEVEKMEIRSRLDFEREEKERMRKLDDIDNSLRQIDREVESGRITETQANTLKFNQEMKKYGTTPPVSLIKPPAEERERYVSPSQQMAAISKLQKEEFKEPTWYDKALQAVSFGALGEEPLTEEEQYYREVLQKTARGEVAAPAGTISSGLPIVKNDADFDALPSGTDFIDPEGNRRRKP